MSDGKRGEGTPWTGTQQDWCPQWRIRRGLWGATASVSAGGLKNMQRKSHWKDKCVATLWGTQKWNLSRGTYIRYFLCFTLKSPESLVYFYPVLVQCQHCRTHVKLCGTRQENTVLSHPSADGTSELECRTGPTDLHFINIAWKLFTYIFMTIFNPLVHIHCCGSEVNSAGWEEKRF